MKSKPVVLKSIIIKVEDAPEFIRNLAINVKYPELSAMAIVKYPEGGANKKDVYHFISHDGFWTSVPPAFLGKESL